jgi:hypothetical protein
MPEQGYTPGIRLDQSEQKPQGGGFSCAVRTQQAEALAAPDGQIDTGNNFLPAVGFA